MNPDYWRRQSADKPLYPDLLWSRPENRQQAGKLLIIGGNAQGFAAADEAYQSATKAGIGTARMYLPDVLQKALGRDFSAGEFGPSTPSGSFSTRALAEGLTMAHWADGVLLAGDLGRNSETAIMLEKFSTTYTGQLTLTKDAADYCLSVAGACLQRPDTCFVISQAQLRRLGIAARFTTAFTFDMDLLRLVGALHDFTLQYPLILITRQHDTFIAAAGGEVSTTPLTGSDPVWRVRTAAATATWWLQNAGRPLAAISSALVAD